MLTDPNAAIDLIKINPMAASINAETLRFYKSGILSDDGDTGSTQTNHAIVIYGTGKGITADGKEVEFWRIRNSWGEHWGEKGNFRVKIDRKGLGVCGINTGFASPTVN